MKELDERIDKIKKEINEMLHSPRKIPDYMTVSQLESTLKELDKMKASRNSEVFFPYYPKGIGDCWLPGDPLGAELMELLDIYINIENRGEG